MCRLQPPKWPVAAAKNCRNCRDSNKIAADLTHVDVLALGKSYVSRFPDRSQAILLVGLRTSGSYFAPLLRALFEAEGYAAPEE